MGGTQSISSIDILLYNSCYYYHYLLLLTTTAVDCTNISLLHSITNIKELSQFYGRKNERLLINTVTRAKT